MRQNNLGILNKIKQWYKINIRGVNMKELANRLKEQRIIHDLKQNEIAKVLNIGTNTYNQYENDKRDPDIETLIKLSSIFKCSIDYLVGRVN